MPSNGAARRGIHFFVGPERRPPRPGRAACLRPADVDEGEATLVCADFQGRSLHGDEFRKAEHFVLCHVPASDGGEEASPPKVEVEPVSARRLLKKGVHPLSRTAGATCIFCTQVVIPVSWSIMANPPSWGSMPVMRCSLSV